MTELIYPTLDLFLYDLRDGLGQSEEEIKNNRNNFKQKLPKKVDEKLFNELDDEKDFEAEYVELLGNKRIEPKRIEPLLEYPNYDGYYYPVRLGDTYGLLLDCSPKNQKSDSDLECFQTFQNLLEKAISQGKTNTTGQTLMFSAALPNYLNEDREAIAKECYNHLITISSWEDNKIGHGDFMGGTIFELWESSSINQTNIHGINHVIIALYPDKKIVEKVAEFYPDWMRLFCYRHKIIWAYVQSRDLKKKLKKVYSEIEDCRREISQHSSQQIDCKKIKKTLDKAWNILSSYATKLNLLDDQARTIEINLYNYKKRLSRIEEKTSEKLTFLKKFSGDVQKKYLLQLQKDYANFAPGLRLLEDLISYIRARVEIEQESRDRNFERNLAIFGFGLATAEILGGFPWTSSKEDKEEALNHPLGVLLKNNVPDHYVAPAITGYFSIGLGLVVGVLTWLVIRRRQSS